VRKELTPFWCVQLDRFLKLVARSHRHAAGWELVDEWKSFLLYGVQDDDDKPPPPKTPDSLRLVVNQKPKPPAPKTTPRWRPPARPSGDDDGPQAA
jgi:hypothetical protein